MPQKTKSTDEIAVIVTTAHKGVFFGYVPKTQKLDAKTMRLTRARMCVYWTTDNHGVTGLAVNGPQKGSRIGFQIPVILVNDITAVMEPTAEAIAAWEAAPWEF